ncbi:MAG: type VI secretion system tip protein TssI/VgrG, partial [Deltaproteobacteria bacterium]
MSNRHEGPQISIESKAFSCEALRVRRFRGREAISRLFDYELDVVSLDRGGPSTADMIGADLTIVIERYASDGAGYVRRLHGMVLEASDELARHDAVRVHTLRVVPKAHALAMVETLDIQMDRTVPEILAAKLEAVGLGGATALRLRGLYPSREFVVQHQETDLAFVSRLAEHLGVSFFFEHGDDEATLVFCDDASGFGLVEGETAPYRPRGEASGVFDLVAKRTLVEGYHAVRDYNYRTPLVDITGEHALEGTFAGGRIEFGSHHKTPEEGRTLARIRAEERLAAELVYTGRSALPSLGAGLRVTVEGHPELGDVALCVTELEHRGSQVVAGFDCPEGAVYENTFRAIPAERTYRPARITPKPRIAGLVTGIVDAAGMPPSTRYASLDAEGRYTVRFLFDTTPSGERRASRPVRMLQNHAGEGYGTHFPLKPGTEVAIGFVGGDPDRPVIV